MAPRTISLANDAARPPDHFLLARESVDQRVRLEQVLTDELAVEASGNGAANQRHC